MKAPSNAEIAVQLRQLAEVLRTRGVNRFKVKAYRAAADAIRSHPVKVGEAVARGGKIPRIPGVGKSISAAIVEIVTSGSLSGVEKFSADLAPGALAIAEAANLSTREAERVARAMNVQTPAALKQKLQRGESGSRLGRRLEIKLKQNLLNAGRLLWGDARQLSEQLISQLAVPGVTDRIEPAGSLRRGKETVGEIRLVVQTREPRVIKQRLRAHGGVTAVHARSPSRLECTLAAGPALIVRLATPATWGSALVEETGSAAHLKDVARHGTAASRRRGYPDETEWYAARGLPWIPPELREGRGEVEAAQNDLIPILIEERQIRGDLHAHTTASDGADSLEAMVAAAQRRGYAYLAITDHSQSLKIARGLDEPRLRKQMGAIDRLNRSLSRFRILKGSEVDILEDGSLDFDDALLRELDVVIASVHSRFSLDKRAQTARLLNAIRNPYVTCIGHLSGRKLLRRPGYEIDTDRVLRAIKAHGKLLEINASPDRLDVDDEVALKARLLGIPLLINTDAHSVEELDFMKFGVQQARRGWQSAGTIVNTLPLAAMLRRLRSTRTRLKARSA